MVPRLDTAWMVLIFLVSLRLGALLLVAPGFGTLQMPIQFRVLLTVGLAVVLATALGPNVPLPDTTLGLLATSLAEIEVGALLGFGVAAVFGAFAVAGRAMDLQIGFGVANLIDPTTRTQSPQMGTLLNLFALAVFFGVGGHDALPLKIFAGILMLALSLPHLGPLMGRIFSSIFRFWESAGA